MQETIINAHRLIGETVREPGQERCGRIVGVDQARAKPVLFVIWQQPEGVQRVELTFDELRKLSEDCARRHPEKGVFSPVERQDATSASPVLKRRVSAR